jgi:hypothetical protein
LISDAEDVIELRDGSRGLLVPDKTNTHCCGDRVGVTIDGRMVDRAADADRLEVDPTPNTVVRGGTGSDQVKRHNVGIGVGGVLDGGIVDDAIDALLRHGVRDYTLDGCHTYWIAAETEALPGGCETCPRARVVRATCATPLIVAFDSAAIRHETL